MEQDIREARAPGFLRRLAAMLYDAVLLFGILMIAVTLLVVPYDLLMGAPFPHEDRFHTLGLQLYLIGVICLFFGFFWTRGGQTLGMRSWRFQMVRDDGSALSWRDALTRLGWTALCLVPAGAGFLWMLVDRDRLTCYDRLSRTKPVMLKE